jgi:hypothetical protein
MTSEQINEAIERITKLESDATKASIANAAVGNDGGWITNRDFRSFMLALLEQADPSTHMDVPRDADGVPIHIGDLIYEEGNEPFLVDEMMVNKAKGWEIFGGGYGEGFSAYDPATCRHYHKPTVEDVLHEFATVIFATGIFPTDDNDKFTHEKIAEYAAKLREVMADE